MRIVNWNVQRPRLTGRKNALQINHLIGLKPDISILTETSTAIDHGPEYLAYFTEPSPRKPGDSEAVAARWVRNSRFYVVGPVETSDPQEAVCVELESDFGPILVYASIVPYHGYKGQNGTSDPWDAHKKAIRWHAQDWARMRARFPGHGVIVGGDFNQTRGGMGGYGTAEVRQLMTEALAAAGLTCVTEADFRATSGLSRQNIDHVCLSSELASVVQNVQA